MKYKSKQTGEIISKELFDQIDHFTCQSSKDYFEPVYEVGDWVKLDIVQDNYPIVKIEGIKEVNSKIRYNPYDRHSIGMCYLWDIARPATVEEIEAAQKKFPFEYETLTNGKNEFRVEEFTKGKNLIRVTDLADYNMVLLSESAWQQIGIRKGWTL